MDRDIKDMDSYVDGVMLTGIYGEERERRRKRSIVGSFQLRGVFFCNIFLSHTILLGTIRRVE